MICATDGGHRRELTTLIHRMHHGVHHLSGLQPCGCKAEFQAVEVGFYAVI